jgi:signal transduction histidine kinase
MRASISRAIGLKPREAVTIRFWPVLLIGFGALVALVALSGISALRRARDSYAGISLLYQTEHRTEQATGNLRDAAQSSAILVRDFLLDPGASVTDTRRELVKSQQSMAAELAELSPLIPPEDAPRLDKLRRGIDEYWQTIDPLFSWTSAQKAHLSAGFLKREVLPRRQAVLNLVAEIQALAYDSVRKRRGEIDRREAELPLHVGRIILGAICMAFLVAAASLFRIFELERIAIRQRRAMESAQRELRDLSQQLVRTQEEERRSLSRELHDQVGQILTAVRINLGNLEEALAVPDDRIRQQIEQTKRLAEQALRSVRDLAMGLRPAMLDDLGLGAALEWQARQHSRLCHVPVTVSIEGDLGGLSDAHRTCVYRIVQEALNNAAKHARAKAIRVSVQCQNDSVSIVVHDDGQGFDLGQSSHGLGLVGMKERVRQLGGDIVIASEPGQGTELLAEIPLTPAEI